MHFTEVENMANKENITKTPNMTEKCGFYRRSYVKPLSSLNRRSMSAGVRIPPPQSRRSLVTSSMSTPKAPVIRHTLSSQMRMNAINQPRAVNTNIQRQSNKFQSSLNKLNSEDKVPKVSNALKPSSTNEHGNNFEKSSSIVKDKFVQHPVIMKQFFKNNS